MPWGTILAVTGITSFVVFMFAAVAGLGYSQGHREGFREGLKAKVALEEKYK